MCVQKDLCVNFWQHHDNQTLKCFLINIELKLCNSKVTVQSRHWWLPEKKYKLRQNSILGPPEGPWLAHFQYDSLRGKNVPVPFMSYKPWGGSIRGQDECRARAFMKSAPPMPWDKHHFKRPILHCSTTRGLRNTVWETSWHWLQTRTAVLSCTFRTSRKLVSPHSSTAKFKLSPINWVWNGRPSVWDRRQR